MKLLVFSDMHSDLKLTRDLLQRGIDKDVDFIIVPGDMTNFSKNLKGVLQLLNDSPKPVYVLPGNHEEGKRFDELVETMPNLTNFHKSYFEFDDYVILGYGGDGFSKEDAEFRKVSRKWYGQFKGRKIVLVTHGPPYLTKLDKLSKKRHVGNVDYRKFIERIKPKLFVCGHLHDTMGEQDTLGETILINPCWEGAIIELD